MRSTHLPCSLWIVALLCLAQLGTARFDDDFNGGNFGGSRSHNSQSDTCRGTASCGSWSERSFGTYSKSKSYDSNADCEYGHTAIDNCDGDKCQGSCQEPCHGHATYQCVCISKADAHASHKTERVIQSVLGCVLLLVCVLGLSCTWSAYCRSRKSGGQGDSMLPGIVERESECESVYACVYISW
jgi:hypothetical protein